MRDQLRTLLVDTEAETAKLLTKALRPEVDLGEVDVSGSTHRALEAMLDTSYNLCLISERIPATELEVFFRDVGKLRRERACIFIQVRESLPPDLDRHCLESLGFEYIISRFGTPKDKAGLKQALHQYFQGCEIRQRVINVDQVMDSALAAIDQAAENIRRGRESQLNKISLDFIAVQTDYDKAVKEQYFDTLSSKSDQAKPVEVKSLEIPAEVLGRKLPHLKHDIYGGSSHRVWKRLTKRYGKKI